MKFSTKVAMLVSSQHKVDAKTRDVFLPRALRKTLAETARLAADRRLAFGTLAEISLRLPGDKMAINRAGTWFASTNEEDFIAVSFTHDRAMITSQPPAAHAQWHRLIYTSTPAEAVFLCQPEGVLQIAEMQLTLNPDLLPDAAKIAGDLPYTLPADVTLQSIACDYRVILIKGIGLLMWGEGVIQTVSLAETIEHWCQLQLAGERIRR